MSSTNRRTFLRIGGAALAASSRRILGANDRVNLAIIGIGGRGRDHIQEYPKAGGVRIAGLCDVNQAARERGVALVQKVAGETPKTYSDMHEVFADSSIDAVSIATPNHWHALATIWACQAGKDVYVEKPACHNVYEGRQMIAAARKYKRMVQVGSQSRSTPHKIRAMQLLRDGVIGELYMAKGLCFKRRKSIGHTPDEPVPPGINWDLFLGPAPMRPFSRNRYAYNWHWFWDTGNGDIGNQGVHEMDICRWGLGLNGMPKSVIATGGKFAYHDDQETPNTQLATFDYGGRQIVFEVRGLLTNYEADLARDSNVAVGNIFFGADGYMTVDFAGFRVYKGEDHKLAEQGEAGEETWATSPHMATFLKAVRSRKVEDLTADVEIGVTSADLCHLANISYRTGKKLEWDESAGRFTGAPDADALLTRDYRAPYVVPQNV